MILPSKHISQDRALLTVGSRILKRLERPKTVSAVWEELPREPKKAKYAVSPLSYNRFVLALDFLFLMGTIELADGLLMRRAS